MSFNKKTFILAMMFCLMLTAVIIIGAICSQPIYRQCKGIAIICQQYYNVYTVKTENDTNYEYYYKSIEVKETSDVVYAIMIDWKTETKTEHKFNKNQYVVVINY